MDGRDLQALREVICDIGRLLYARGHVVSNDGNLSVRCGNNALLITPSGVNKGRMTPEMLALCDLEGRLLEGPRQPSSEVKMHLAVMRARPDVAAVLHAHPPHATAFAAARRPIEKRYLPELLVNIGRVPVAPFAMPSTEEVPQSVLPYLDGQAVLLANHGLLVWAGGLAPAAWNAPDAAGLLAADLWAAFDRLEVVEYAARVEMLVAQLGGGVELDDARAEQVLALRGFYRERAKPE